LHFSVKDQGNYPDLLTSLSTYWFDRKPVYPAVWQLKLKSVRAWGSRSPRTKQREHELCKLLACAPSSA